MLVIVLLLQDVSACSDHEHVPYAIIEKHLNKVDTNKIPTVMNMDINSYPCNYMLKGIAVLTNKGTWYIICAELCLLQAPDLAGFISSWVGRGTTYLVEVFSSCLKIEAMQWDLTIKHKGCKQTLNWNEWVQTHLILYDNCR